MCSPSHEVRGPGQSLGHTGPGGTQIQGSPSWCTTDCSAGSRAWIAQCVLEQFFGQLIWSNFGQLDSVKISANWIWSDSVN